RPNPSAFVTLKYDLNLVFKSSAVLPGDASNRGIALDESGNVYVAGSTKVAGGLYNFRVVKYHPNLVGMNSAVFTSGGGASEEALAVAAANGNLYVTGRSLLSGATRFLTAQFDYNLNPLNLRIYSAGVPRLVAEWPDMGVAVDKNSGSVYVTGSAESPYHGILTIKYNSVLTQITTHTYTSGNSGSEVQVDKSGNVFVVGTYDGGSGYGDDWVAVRYDPSLVVQSTQVYHASAMDEALGSALDGAGGLYAAGFSRAGNLESGDDARVIRFTPAGPPTSAITAPAHGSTLTSLLTISGTAAAANGVQKVGVSIRRPDWQYWNGSAYTPIPTWLLAVGTTGWMLNTVFGVDSATGPYVIVSSAADMSGNLQTQFSLGVSSIVVTRQALDVSNVTVMSRSSTSIEAAWGPNGNAADQNYHLHFGTATSCSDIYFVTCGSCTAYQAGTAQAISGLNPGTSYFFNIHTEYNGSSPYFLLRTRNASDLGSEPNPMFLACGSESGGGAAQGGLAIAFDNAQYLWEVIGVNGIIQLSKFNASLSPAVFLSSTALPDASDNGFLSLDFDASNNAYAVGTASAGSVQNMAVYKIGVNGGLISSRTYVNNAYGSNAYALGSTTNPATGDIWIAGAIQTGGPINDKLPGNRSFAAALWKYNMASETLTGPTTLYFGLNGVEIWTDVKADSVGNLWVLGLSSNPANASPAKYSLVLSSYNNTGTGRLGGPFTRPDYVVDINDSIGKLALTASGIYAAYTKINTMGNTDLALLKFDTNGALMFETFWHDNAFMDDEFVQGLAVRPTGNLLMVGRIAGDTQNKKLAVWEYQNNGSLVSAQTMLGAREGEGIAVNANGDIWLATDSTAPVKFMGGSALNGADGLQASPTGTVSGIIRRQQDSSPMAGALVEAIQSQAVAASATTDVNGAYSLSLTTGAYSIKATSSGFVVKIASNVLVFTSPPTTIDMSLQTGTPKLLFAVSQGPGSSIMTMDPDGKNKVVIKSAAGSIRNPVYSPDSTQIAYTADVGSGYFDIHVMGADGAGDHVVKTSNNGIPAWSVDGQWIYYSYSPAVCYSSIYRIKTDGAGDQLFLSPSIVADQEAAGLSFSRDGKTVYWASQDGCSPATYDLFRASVISGAVYSPSVFRLSNDSLMDVLFNQAVNPVDGKAVYAHMTAGGLEIFRINGDGSGAAQLTNNVVPDAGASWSPDGSKIAWVRGDNGSGAAWVMNQDGTAPVQVTSTGDVQGISWGVVHEIPRPFNYFVGSGNFTTGSRIDTNTGKNEAARFVLIDTVTVGGPFIYTTVISTPGGLSEGGESYLVKYDQYGTILSTALIPGLGGGDAIVMDGDKNLYVGYWFVRSTMDVNAIASFDKNLNFRTSIELPNVNGISAMDSDGNTIYAVCDGPNYVSVFRFDKNLYQIGSASWYIYIGFSHDGDGMSVGPDGNVYVSGHAGSIRKLAKFSPDLYTLLGERDVTSLMPNLTGLQVIGPSLFAAALDPVSGSSITLAKLDTNLNVILSTKIVGTKDLIGMKEAALRGGPEGDLYLAATVNGAGGGDYAAMRFTPALALVSSAAFGGPGADQALGLGVLDSTHVYVTGVFNLSGNMDAMTIGLNLTGSGAPPVQGAGFVGGAVFDPNKNLWAGFPSLKQIRKFTSPAPPITQQTASSATLATGDDPLFMALDSANNLWVSVRSSVKTNIGDNDRLVRYAWAGNGFAASTSATLSAGLKDVAGIALKPDTGELWAANRGGPDTPSPASVVRFYRGGTSTAPVYSDVSMSTFAAPSSIFRPSAVAFDKANNLWVSMPSSGVIRMYANTSGAISNAPSVVLNYIQKPWALAFNAKGDVFVSDTDPDSVTGSGGLWAHKNLGTASAPNLSLSAELLQGGVDLLGMVFESTQPAAGLWGSDMNQSAIIRLSTGASRPPQLYGNISGQVQYYGSRTGAYIIYYTTNTSYEQMTPAAASLGAYYLAGLPAPNTYYVVAILDGDGNGEPDGFEPTGGAYGVGFAPVYVTANSTTTGVNILLRDKAAFAGAITNNSLQAGGVLVEAWSGQPNDAAPQNMMDRWWVPSSTYTIYVDTISILYVRAFVDSNYSYTYDSGEDYAVIGPLMNLTPGTTAASGTNITIGLTAGGSVYAAGVDLSSPVLPTSVYDRPMLKLNLWTQGGGAQINSILVSMLGDAIPMNAWVTIYKDMNGDGQFQSGMDNWLGSQSFGQGSPPMAAVYFSTQPLNSAGSTFYAVLGYSGMPIGRKIGLAVENASRFGIVYGQMGAQNLYPIQSSTATVQLTLFARPPDGYYPYPYANPYASGGFETGVFISSGQNVRVTASGSWGTGAPNPPSGPDGLASLGGLGGNLKIGSLVGRIGGGQWFQLGSNFTFSRPEVGGLVLAMNDYQGQYDDDFGQAAINVELIASTITKTWTGASGFSLSASVDSNWIPAGAPLPGDNVLFKGSVSTRSCDWDLFGAELGGLSMSADYIGTVKLGGPGYLHLSVTTDVFVNGGRLSLAQNSGLSVAGRLIVSSGTLDMGAGYTNLNLGPRGILVRYGGSFLSAGSGYVNIQSQSTYERFPFIVDDGTVTFSNASGTEIRGVSSVDLSTRTSLSGFNYVRFYDSQTTSNPNPVLVLRSNAAVQWTLQNLAFGYGLTYNIDASNVAAGSTLTLRDATGERMGSPYETDPNKVLFWSPDGGGIALASGTLTYVGLGPFTIWASTNPKPDFGSTLYSSTVIANAGAFPQLSLQAPNTWYFFAWKGGTSSLSGFTPRGGFGHAGLFVSEPVQLANSDSRSNINITLADWGGSSGTVVNNSSQIGPILVQGWIGEPQVGTSARTFTYLLPGNGGYFSADAAAGTDRVLAFVDLNGNQFADEFEARSSFTVTAVSANSVRDAGAITLAGGTAMAGGSLRVASVEPIHGGIIGAQGPNAMLKLVLSPSGGSVMLSGMRVDVDGLIPGQPFYVGLVRDNGDGIFNAYMPGTAGMGDMGDQTIAMFSSMGAPAQLSSATLALWSPQTLTGSATFFITLAINNMTPPLALRIADSTCFALSQGTMDTQKLPVFSGFASVLFSVDAMTGVNYNGPNTGGVDTGRFVPQGLTVKISTAVGTWSRGSGSSFGPEGQAGTQYMGGALNEAKLGELIGRFGDWGWGSNWFRIGAGTVITAPMSGRLFLAINDIQTEYWDNSGRVFVDFQATGSTSSAIMGQISYAGTDSIIVGSTMVYAFNPNCFSSNRTVTVNYPTNTTFEFTGLCPGRYEVGGYALTNATHRGKVPGELYVNASSTASVYLDIAQGFGYISGRLDYSGFQQYGSYFVVASTMTDWEEQVVFIGSVTVAAFTSSATYVISDLPASATPYLLAAFRDVNYNQEPDGNEPIGVAGTTAPFAMADMNTVLQSSPIYVDANKTSPNINIRLNDRGAIQGIITAPGIVVNKPLKALAGHGFSGSPGFVPENLEYVRENVAYQDGGMCMMAASACSMPTQCCSGLCQNSVCQPQTSFNYTVGLLKAATDYSILVWMDSNYDDRLNPGEPFGQSPGLITVNAGGYAYTDITLQGAVPPQQVRSFQGTPVSSTTILWSWGAAPGATYYQLLDVSTGVVVSSMVLLNNTTYFETLAPNVLSAIVMSRAGNDVGLGPVSARVQPVRTLASVPSAVSVAGVWESSATLAWSANNNSAWTLFEVWRATFNDVASYGLMAGTKAATWTDYGLVPGSTYFYRVIARNSYGTPTGLSNSASVPANTLSATGGNSISGAIAYGGRQAGQIMVKAVRTSDASTVFVSSLPVFGLQNYYLRVLASPATSYYLSAYVDVNGNGLRDAGEDSSGQSLLGISGALAGQNFTISSDTVKPGAPMNLTASASLGQIALTWNPPTKNADGAALNDLAGLRIERSTTSSGPWVILSSSTLYGIAGLVPGLNSAFTDYAPMPGITNIYRVTAVDFGQNPGVPASVSILAQNGGTISGDVTYSGTASTVPYRVRLSTGPNASDGFIMESMVSPFTFTGLQPGAYYLRAFKDMNGDASQAALSEPAGTHGGINAPFPLQVYGSNRITGATVGICDRTAVMSFPASFAGMLSMNSCPASDVGPGYYTDIYAFSAGYGAGQLSPGSSIEIRMMSTSFAGRLVLIGPSGNIVADDSRPEGASLRATLLEAGVYHIIPTSFSPGMTGPYTLSFSASARLGGTVSYYGVRPGSVTVQLFNSAEASAYPMQSRSFASTGTYSFDNMPDGTYYIRAFKDVNNNYVKDMSEPSGVYGLSASSPTAIRVLNSVPSVSPANFAISDPSLGAVAGQVLHVGNSSGAFRVEIGMNKCSDCDDLDVTAFLSLQAPGSYTLPLIPTATTYVLRAYLDMNGSGRADGLEPIASSRPVIVAANSTTTVNLTVRDMGTGPSGNSSISGTLAYSGTQTGQILIGIAASERFEYIPYTLMLSNTGAFLKSGVSGNATYYIGGFVDVNGNGVPDESLGEPNGDIQDGNGEGVPFFVPLSSAVSVGTLTLQDPPNGSIMGRVSLNNMAASAGQKVIVQAWVPNNQGRYGWGQAKVPVQAGISAYNYQISFLGAATNYSLNAYIDVNGNERSDFGEPFTQFGQTFCQGMGPCYGQPVLVSSGSGVSPTTNIDFTFGQVISQNSRGLEGEASYFGNRVGSVRFRIFETPFIGEPRFTAAGNVVGPGRYSFRQDLLPAGTYYIDAFMDSDYDGVVDESFEAQGRMNSGGPVPLTGGIYLQKVYGSLRDPGAGGTVNVFSGDFSQAGGARFDGGATDLGAFIARDTNTAGGPFTYVLGASEQANGMAAMLAKYGPSGVTHATYTFYGAGDSFSGVGVSNDGYVYVIGSAKGQVTLLNSNLLKVTTLQAENSDFNGYTRCGAGASCLGLTDYYANKAMIWRVNNSLAVSAISTVSFASSYLGLNDSPKIEALGADADGNVYAFASRGPARMLAKFNASLGTLLAQKEISSVVPQQKGGAMAVDSAGNVYLAFYDFTSAAPAGKIVKFDSSLTQGATYTRSNIMTRFQAAQNVCAAPDGQVYAVWEASERGGDYLVERLDGSLTLLSSRTYDGGFNAEDIPNAVAASTMSNIVYVAGAAGNGQNPDWATLRFNMTTAGVSSGTVVLVTTLRDTVAGTLRYSGMQASTGTLRAFLFPVIAGGTSNPIRSTSTYMASTPTALGYLFNNVPMGSYQIRAFLDRNDNYMMDPGEPAGLSASDGFYFGGGSLAGQDAGICDRLQIAMGEVVSSAVSATDCASPDRGNWMANSFAGAYQRFFSFEGSRGQIVTIEMKSAFYNFLSLYDKNGGRAAFNDNGAGNGNARIQNFMLPIDGAYIIAASAFNPGVTGPFTLSLGASSVGGALGSISGALSYTGSQGGRIAMALFSSTTFNQSFFVRGLEMPGPGPYTFTDLAVGASFYLAAFVDANYNGNPDPGEDSARYSLDGIHASPLYLQRSGQVMTGIDFTIAGSSQYVANIANISGAMAYGGARTGQLIVQCWADPKFQDRPVAQMPVPTGLGPYSVSVPGGVPYFVRIFMDLNGNYALDADEPRGVYSPSGQGAEPVFTPMSGEMANIVVVLKDPFQTPSGVAAGEGWATVSPLSAAGGTVLANVTVKVFVGPSGIAPAVNPNTLPPNYGLVVVGLPQGWYPDNPNAVVVTPTNVGIRAATIDTRKVPSGGLAVEAYVTSASTPLYPGATVQFVFPNVHVPCYAYDAVFRIGTLSSATAAGMPSYGPMPLISGEPSMTLVPGAAQSFMARNGYLSLRQNQLSEVQTLDAYDACGEMAAVAAPTAVNLLGVRYSYETGQFDTVADLKISTNSPPAFLSHSATATFTVGQSSRTFYIRSAAAGDLTIKVLPNLMNAVTFYASVNVLPGNVLANVTVSTVAFVMDGSSTALITPNGDKNADQAFINFSLADPNLGWQILVASSPFMEGTVPVWQTWGYGLPAKGQYAWDGRHSPWINGGARVPSGQYYVRIEIGAGVRDDSLQVRVLAPQLNGEVFDNGSMVPLSEASIELYGTYGGQTASSFLPPEDVENAAGTVCRDNADYCRNFKLAGLAAGDYEAKFTREGYVPGSARIRLDSAGAVSSFTVVSSDLSLSTTSVGGLNIYMTRAPSLIVTPQIDTAKATELWGGIQVQNLTYTRMFYAPLHLLAGATTFDTGEQWDPSVQRFVTKYQFRFDIPPDTYTVRASLPGYDEVSMTTVLGRGAQTLALAPFAARRQISGSVWLPQTYSNVSGVFVSVNAVPISTTSGVAISSNVFEGFTSTFVAAGRSSETYVIAGLKPGVYRLSANARGFAAVSIASVAVAAVDVSTSFPAFADSATVNKIGGNVTVNGNTSNFSNLPDGSAKLKVHINAWSPGSMNYGQADVAVSSHPSSASASYVIRGLDSGTTYQVFAWLERSTASAGEFESPGGFPKLVYVEPASSGTLNFSFDASAGVIQGAVYLSSSDFSNVQLFGETVASVRPERVGQKFEDPQFFVTVEPNKTAVCGNGASTAPLGNCPVGINVASFTVRGLNTETYDITMLHRPTGKAVKQRIPVVNGSTTTVQVDLRILDIRSSTYSISGSILNQIQSPLFNTNEKIVQNAGHVALRVTASTKAWSVADLPPPVVSTASLARVVALRQEFGKVNITTTANPATDRVGFLSAAGTFTITGLTPGVYFVRTANLRECTTCEIRVPLAGQQVTITTFSVAGTSITLRDGYNVSGAISLANSMLDARTLRVSVLNKRQEVIRSTPAALGNAGTGSTANSVDYAFRGLPGKEFYSVLVEDVSDNPKYVGRPLKVPDTGLSASGLQSDLSRQDITLQRAAFIAGKVKDSNSGEQITAANANILAPNFKISATANPWVEGGYVVAPSSAQGRPIRADGAFRVGPLLPDIPYDLKLAQEMWDLAYLAQGSQNYAPVTVAGLKPGPGETRDVGVIGLNQGTSIKGRVVDAGSAATALGNIKVLAKPSFGVASDLLVQTFTSGAGEFTIWVSSAVSKQYDITLAPREGNTASTGKVYRQLDLLNHRVSTTPLTIALQELLGSVTGQVLTADGGALSYPFGDQRDFSAAAVFLQRKGVVPTGNPLGDIEAQTSVDGHFEIPGLSTGVYTMRVVSLGYSVLEATVSVSAASAYIFQGIDAPANRFAGNILTLLRGAVVTGRILLPSGSAPNDTEVGGVAATNRGFSEFVMGAVEVDPIARTVNGYSISGFKPGISYDIVILPKEGDELIFPPEGEGLRFALSEATTTKNINLTFNAGVPDCSADALLKTLGAGETQYQIKIICSGPLRNTAASDNDLDAILSVHTGSGTLLGGDRKKIEANRRQITAVYRSTVTEAGFSLKLEAYSQSVDPTTGQNYVLSRTFPFNAVHDTSHKERVSNIQGASVRLQPSDLDVSCQRDEKFRTDIPAGAIQTEDEYQRGLDPSATTQTTVEVRRIFTSTQAAACSSVGPSALYLATLKKAQAFAPEAFQAMANAPNPMSAFYDVFLPRGVRAQLRRPANLTLSYQVSAASAAMPADELMKILNIWYFKGLGATCDDGQPAKQGYCLENNGKDIDTVNKTITVAVNHYSQFVVFAATPIVTGTQPFNGDEIMAFNFPNPSDCIVHDKPLDSVVFGGGRNVSFEGTLIRYGLPPGESAELKIKVYNVAGELVREFSQGNLAGGRTYYTPWDCKNNSGRTIASGVYIGQIKWGGMNRFFKMAIIKGSGL
ncbi:MAG: carboxypeptidase regulatory-like domain-containing protein, partial [Elusimicrobia bacterium]|nr:carboxypeptidase regulatory-like domain-containing protein [Elusimicrobiota bacterium]